MLTKIDQEITRWNNVSDVEVLIEEVCKQSNWRLEDSGQWKHMESLERTELVERLIDASWAKTRRSDQARLSSEERRKNG